MNNCRICGRFCGEHLFCKRCYDAFPTAAEIADGVKEKKIPDFPATFIVK